MPATNHPHSLCERLEAVYERMRGPCLKAALLSWRHGAAQGQMALRGPRRVWDCIDIHFVGASCPELFLRVDDHAWRYLGSVLVGADASTRARSERHVLGVLAAGQEARVVLRELPGELATIEARLWASVDGTRWLLDAVPITELGANCVMALHAPVQAHPVELELEVTGFFIRLGESEVLQHTVNVQ
jgi:hypothetical protein